MITALQGSKLRAATKLRRRVLETLLGKEDLI